MQLNFNQSVFITCAVTGSGNTVGKSPHVPVTPSEIARSAIEAAKAGAAIVHCHVRDPDSGKPSRKIELYREVTERIRDAEVDVIINLTAGMGGDLVLGSGSDPTDFNRNKTDLVNSNERTSHLAICRPEIATLDCGTMNFAEADYLLVNSPGMLREMAGIMRGLNIRPELELFDGGHLRFAQQLEREGLLNEPIMAQLCMGIPWGCSNDLPSFVAMAGNVPQGWTWSAFSIGRFQMPYVAAAVLAGGNVRVGLEDNLLLSKGEFAQNWQLVERAVSIVEALGASVIGPSEVREKLRLVKQAVVTD